MTRHARRPGRARRAAAWLRARATLILGVLVLLVAVHMGVDYWRFSTCQADVNAGFLRALGERQAATAAQLDAQRRLIVELIRPGLSEEDKRVARVAYLTALDELDRARAASPLPEPRPCR